MSHVLGTALGLAAVVIAVLVAALATRAPNGVPVVAGGCGVQLVVLDEDGLPSRSVQVLAGLRSGGGSAFLPVIADDALVVRGASSGHQSFEPAAGGLTLAFRLPVGATVAREIRGEEGEVVRRVTFARLLQCDRTS